MSRRVKLPGASELFRPTGSDAPAPKKSKGERTVEAVRVVETDASPGSEPDRAEPAVSEVSPIKPVHSVPPVKQPDPTTAAGTGRVRHEEKITVYVSRDELLALEHARLMLRAELGLAVDRGRLVRAAISLALADLDGAGTEGEIVRRLTAS